MLQWKGLLKLPLPSVTRWQDDPQTEGNKCTDPLNSVSLISFKFKSSDSVKFTLGIEFAYDFVAFSKWISEMA